MADNAVMFATAKPAYSPQDLRRLNREVLLKRLVWIDNQTAREIATQLWNRTMSARPGLFRNPGSSSRLFGMESMAGRKFDEMPELLEDMRHVSFGQIVIGKSTMISDRLSELPALVRLLMANPYPRSSRSAADHLIRYLDLYLNPHCRMPQHLIYLGLEYFSWAGMLGIGFGSMLAWPLWTLLIFFLPSLLLGSRMTMSRNLQRIRLLALYISFTDEFVEREHHPEDAQDG
jgi:hypothetical protein